MRRALVLFTVLALVLGGYLFGVELPRDERARERADAALDLFDFQVDDVDTLAYFRENLRIVLARDGAQWELLEPLEEAAMGSAVRAQLEQFSQALAVKVLADSVRTEDLSFYGLLDHAHGRRDIRIHTRDGRVHHLAVGNETPSGGFAYALAGDGRRLLMVERNVHQLSWVRPSGVRRVELFDVEDSLITRVRVTGPFDTWSAVRDAEGRWWQDDPSSDRYFSRRQLRRIVYDLSHSNIRSYERRFEAGAGDWRAYGLEPPYGTIEWWGPRGRSGRLDLGNDYDDKEAFARRDLSADLLRVTRQLVVDVESRADSLLDHNPVRFNFDRADSVVLRWTAGPRLSLIHEGDRWGVAGRLPDTADSDNLTLAAKNFVFALENLQSDRTWLLPATDSMDEVLDEIPLRIRVFRGRRAERDLRLGWQEETKAHHWLSVDDPSTLYRMPRTLYVGARGLGLLTGRLQP